MIFRLLLYITNICLPEHALMVAISVFQNKDERASLPKALYDTKVRERERSWLSALVNRSGQRRTSLGPMSKLKLVSNFPLWCSRGTISSLDIYLSTYPYAKDHGMVLGTNRFGLNNDAVKAVWHHKSEMNEGLFLLILHHFQESLCVQRMYVHIAHIEDYQRGDIFTDGRYLSGHADPYIPSTSNSSKDLLALMERTLERSSQWNPIYHWVSVYLSVIVGGLTRENNA